MARVPFSCAIRLQVRNWLARARLYVFVLAGIVASFFYARSRWRSHQTTRAKIPALVDIVLERLTAQKELSYESDVDDSFLFLPNLRDDVLRSTHSVRDREHVWQRVRAVVEQNSNVRTGQREGQNGEVGRAWEWIGPTSAGEGSARRRRSGRVSWGPDVKASDEDEAKPTSPEMDEDRTKIHRKWQESRPIY